MSTAFSLLTLPHATLRTPSEETSGMLNLDCINPTGSAVFLLIRINSFELPIDPSRSISLSVDPDGVRTYTFHYPSTESPVEAIGATFAHLSVTPPSHSTRSNPQDHIDTLDNILTEYSRGPFKAGTPPTTAIEVDSSAQYPRIHEGPAAQDASLRGRLVLMDEDSGEVVGELPQRVPIEEDASIGCADNAKDTAPVMLELPPNVYDAYTSGATFAPITVGDKLEEQRAIFVRIIPPEEQDWITKSASLISTVISSSTTLFLTGLSTVSTYYINHSTPSPPATPTAGPSSRAQSLLSHPATNATLSRAHALSGQAVRVSQRTASMVDKMIKKAVFGQTGENQEQAEPTFQDDSDTRIAPAEEARSAADDLPPPYPGIPTIAYVPRRAPRRQSSLPTVAGTPPPLPPRRAPARTLHTRQSNSLSNLPLANDDDLSRPSSPTKKPVKTKDRLLMSANLVLTTMDDSAKRVWEVSNERLEAVVGHKFGAEAAQNTHLVTHTARNVVLVYVDMQGFARRALFNKAGKEFVKARVSGPAKPSSSSAPASPAATPAATPSRSASPATPEAVSPGGATPYAEYKRSRSKSREPKLWEGVQVSYAVRRQPAAVRI